MTIILIHTIGAGLAFLAGIILLTGRKGTGLHKYLGWGFVILMAMVALSAGFIQEIRPGQFSLIHLLIPISLISLWQAIHAIRRYQQTGDPAYRVRHRRIMRSLFLGALVVAGGFTLMPGRMIHDWLF